MPEIIQINAHTWRFEDDFVRFFLLEGRDRAALIDSGVNCPEAAGLAKTLTEKPLILLNTHGDGDHISGTGSFPKIHMHPLDYARCEISARFPATPLAELRDGDVIDLGERPLQIIHIPGHTAGSVAILDVKGRVLYAGDSVQKGHIYMFGSKRIPGQFESSLDKLTALKNEYDCIYASHDEFMLPNDYAARVKAVWRQVQRGELPYETIALQGTEVRSYSAPACGFYTDPAGGFTVKEMLAMQQTLQNKYKDKWEKICPETGKNKLLWMVGEIGEVIDIVKKNGGAGASGDPALREHLVEEMADVLMYYNDVLLCYGISDEELKAAYTAKFERNMKRW